LKLCDEGRGNILLQFTIPWLAGRVTQFDGTHCRAAVVEEEEDTELEPELVVGAALLVIMLIVLLVVVLVALLVVGAMLDWEVLGG
jgi:uncharacterized membrane protein YqjE